MGYDGEFQIAFYGQKHILQKLPETIEQWLNSDSLEYEDEDGALNELEDLVRKNGKKLSAKSEQQTDVLYLDYLYTSNAVGVLAWLNAVAQSYPELEVAVAAQLDSAPFSFYSAPGEHEVCKNIQEWEYYPDFTKSCASNLQVLVYGETAAGEVFQFDLLDVIHIEKMPFGENGLPFSYFGEAEVLFDEGIPMLLGNDRNGQWFYVMPADDFEEGCGAFSACKKEELSRALLLSSQRKSFIWDGSGDTLQEGLRQLYPEIQFAVELLDGTPKISDESGNTYYMGGMLHVGEISEKTNWGFPPQAEWIPFV